MWRFFDIINPVHIVRRLRPKRFVRIIFRFILPNVFLAALILLFLYLDRFELFKYAIVCPLHYFGLYCPVCGMTRAAHSLLRFDFAAMISYHPLMPLFIAMILFYETALFMSVWQRRRVLAHPRRMAYFTVAAFLVYFIVRNVMLLIFKIDPVGDFIPISA